jgi:hypothetical protein
MSRWSQFGAEDQRFGVRHFGNPEDKEPGHLEWKSPKLWNTTYRGVGLRSQSYMFRKFRIRHFGHPGDKKSGTWNWKSRSRETRHAFEKGLWSWRTQSHRPEFHQFSISEFGGSKSRGTRCQGSWNRETRNPFFGKRSRSCLEAICRWNLSPSACLCRWSFWERTCVSGSSGFSEGRKNHFGSADPKGEWSWADLGPRVGGLRKVW